MQHVLISGASRGVGRAVALDFAARGKRLTLLGRDSAEQEETARLLQQAGAEFQILPCELARRDALSRALAALASPVDVVVHNAGLIERSSITQTTDESWDRQLEVNLTAPFLLTRALLPAMLERGQGRVLFVSSISALVGTKGQAAYHASKAGMLGLMRCLAEELSDTGVSTMALLPGAIDTRMLQGSGFAPRMTAEQVARTLSFYAFDASTAHNGAVVEMFGT